MGVTSRLDQPDTPSRARGLTPSVSAIAELRAENAELRRTVATQARLLALLAPETSPAAPSVNCLYWLYAPHKWHGKSWRGEWHRLMPTLAGLGQMPAPDITPIAWEAHRARRRQENHRRGQPCKEVTLNVELQRLKALLDWAVANQIIKFNPLAMAKYVKVKCRRETELRHWDVTAMLEAASQKRDRRLLPEDDDGRQAAQLRAFILLCFDSMMRFNEARHCRRDYIEAGGDYRLSEATKNGKRRIVTLTPRTLEAIEDVPTIPGTNYIFANPDTGKLLGETTMRGWFRWACQHGNLDARAAEGETISAHHLRHAGATAADAAGVRPGALMDVMGHERTATLERYIHRDKLDGARHVAALMAEAARVPPQRAPRSKKNATRT